MITVRELKAQVDNANRAMGFAVPFTEGGVGWHREIGSLRLSQAYGGYAVHRLSNEHGGVSALTSYVTRRECKAFLRGYLEAVAYESE